MQPPKLPSPSGLGKMNSAPLHSLSPPLSPPCLLARGFDTHPSREITHFHIPALFPGLFCFLKTTFVCQHIRAMGGWVSSQANKREEEGVCVCVDWGDKVEKKTGNSMGGKKKKTPFKSG